jgi:glycosyltransferase involved in cell wall biosynthesis
VTRPLKIGVDARELLGDATGVGRYLGELMRRWTTRPDSEKRRFILYAPRPLPLALREGAAELRIVGKGAGTWWEQTSLRRAAKADDLDTFFAPAYTAPLGLGVPLAVTIHDISFIAHPEWFRPRERLRRRWLTGRAAASAAVVFTDSAFSRRELETRLRVDPRRIRVIPPGVSDRRHSGVADREPLALYVGTLFNRRRLPELISAFARAAADLPSARLVIAGADRTWPRQDLRAAAERCGVSAKVDLRDYVPEGELADLYAKASVFAFLSEYEGFGLTPLDALAAGVPIVVLDTPIAREVYGEAAEYVARDDTTGTAAALRRFLTSRQAAEAQLAKAPAVLARYSWDRAADQTLEQIERIVVRP